MNTLLSLPELRQPGRRAPEGTISGQVVSLLDTAYPPGKIERRREERIPYPQLIYLTECGADGSPRAADFSPLIADLLPIAAGLDGTAPSATGTPRTGPTGTDGIIVVVGKHLSRSGLGFFHKEPIPHRRMIVSFESQPGKWLGFLIDITWCRFNGHGWYDSGGRFLKVMPSPFNVSG